MPVLNFNSGRLSIALWGTTVLLFNCFYRADLRSFLMRRRWGDDVDTDADAVAAGKTVYYTMYDYPPALAEAKGLAREFWGEEAAEKLVRVVYSRYIP